jgi:hypothetical protein
LFHFCLLEFVECRITFAGIIYLHAILRISILPKVNLKKSQSNSKCGGLLVFFCDLKISGLSRSDEISFKTSRPPGLHGLAFFHAEMLDVMPSFSSSHIEMSLSVNLNKVPNFPSSTTETSILSHSIAIFASFKEPFSKYEIFILNLSDCFL